MRFTVYSDSEIVIAWVRNQREIENKFVKKRVNAIRKIIKPCQIHHVRSEDNPSDQPSRGLTVEQLRITSGLMDQHGWKKKSYPQPRLANLQRMISRKLNTNKWRYPLEWKYPERWRMVRQILQPSKISTNRGLFASLAKQEKGSNTRRGSHQIKKYNSEATTEKELWHWNHIGE